MNEKMAVKAEDVMLWRLVKFGTAGFGIGVLLSVLLYDICRAIF